MPPLKNESRASCMTRQLRKTNEYSKVIDRLSVPRLYAGKIMRDVEERVEGVWYFVEKDTRATLVQP